MGILKSKDGMEWKWLFVDWFLWKLPIHVMVMKSIWSLRPTEIEVGQVENLSRTSINRYRGVQQILLQINLLDAMNLSKKGFYIFQIEATECVTECIYDRVTLIYVIYCKNTINTDNLDASQFDGKRFLFLYPMIPISILQMEIFKT